MRLRTWLLAVLISLLPALSLLTAADGKSDDTGITWKKTVLDTKFRSEGVAVADVNKDGKIDILAGEVWYEAPDWKMHEIQQAGRLRHGPAATATASLAGPTTSTATVSRT